MFNLISLQCIGLPWNTEWKISKPEKGTCKGLLHKQAVKSRTLTYVILKSQELLAFSVNTAKEACILISHFYELGPYHFNVAIN